MTAITAANKEIIIINPYQHLSKYYDRLNYDCDYDKWSQYLFNFIKREGGKRGVDTACGTGNITLRLKKAGLDVTGIDISPEMLSIAQTKSRNEGQDILFINADIKNFKLPKAVDFIICADDGLNYIKKEQLECCLKNCYKNLKKGGLLLFDISSAYKLKNIIANNVFFDDCEDMTYIWNNSLQNDRVLMNLIFFCKAANKIFAF